MLIAPKQVHVWDDVERDWMPGDVGDISGNVTIPQFNGGVGATGTSFWRGDGVWAVPTAGSIGGIVDPGTNGLVVRTGPGVSVARQLVAPAAGFTINNNDGTTGNPTFVLADDLAAVEGIGGTGFVRRTALNTWSASAIVAGDLPGSFAGFGNPTSQVGLSVINGSATTAMRSDGAPALNQTIAPTWTGQHIFSKAGAASTPTLSLTGTWFSGGSATTTKPQLLVEPSGTTSTAWSTSGTGFGLNAASGFVGNLIDAQLAGSSRFYVTSTAIVHIKPGNRSYIIDADDPAGTMRFGRSDVPGSYLTLLASASYVKFGSAGASNILFEHVGGGIVFTPTAGGGAGVVQFGRRFSDNHPAVGASVEFWPITGQTTPVISTVPPGGGSYRFKVMVAGDTYIPLTDTSTNVVGNALILGHNSSGTPAANFGTGLSFQGKSNSTADRDMAQISTVWTTATDASRTADLLFYTVNNGGALTSQLKIAGDGKVTIVNTAGIWNTAPDPKIGLNITKSGLTGGGYYGIKTSITGTDTSVPGLIYAGASFSATCDTTTNIGDHNVTIGIIANATKSNTGRNDGVIGVQINSSNGGTGVAQDLYGAVLTMYNDSTVGQAHGFLADIIQYGASANMNLSTQMFEGKYRHLGTTAGAHALSVAGVRLWGWTKGSATIDTSYGIYMDSSIDIGTARWALYSLSTSPSLLTGDLTISGLLKAGTSPTTITNAGGQVLVTVINAAALGFSAVPRVNGSNLFEASAIFDDGSDINIDPSGYLNLTSGFDITLSASDGITLQSNTIITVRNSFSDVVIGDDSGLGNGVRLNVSNAAGWITTSASIVPETYGPQLGDSGSLGWSVLFLSNNTGTRTTALTAPTISSNRTVTFPNANTMIPVSPWLITFSGLSANRTVTLPDANITVARTDATNTFTGNQIFINHLLPNQTDTSDLGSSTVLWRKGWLSELDAVLFAQNTATVIGGWFIIGKNEGTIPVAQDVLAAHTTIDFGQAMTTNDFVLFRAALKVEYVQIVSLSSGTRYNVTRNADGSGANDWPAGSVYLVLGNTGNGRIELNAYDTPRISVINQGATYNAQTELVRIGDLDGGWGAGSNTFGFAVGQYNVAGKSSLRIDDSGIHFYSVITERIRLLADGSGYVANSNISWDTAGVATISGWTINSAAIVKDTGSNSTSAGMAPTDFPFFAGATYANRATAVFRVTPAGAVTATSGTIGGWTLGSTTFTGGNITLDSAGVLRAGATAILTTNGWYFDYNSGTPRARIGTVSGGVLSKGLYWDGSNLQIIGTNFSVDASGNITATGGTIAGWTLSTTALTNGSVKLASNVDIVNTAGTGEGWFGRGSSGYYGIFLKGTTGAHISMVAGNAGIGSAGRPYFVIHDATRYRIAIGELNTTAWDGVASNSMGMKIWNSAGTKLVEFSDIANTISGWTIGSGAITSTNVSLTSGASAYLAFGGTLPTSATTGTGTFNDATGFYGLVSNVQTFSLSSSTGVLKIGSNLSSATTTAFVVAGTAVTYNSESLTAGDIIIGDNSTSKANIRWNKTAGQLQFRTATTVHAYIDTDGALKAGAGNVVLNSSGMIIKSGSVNSANQTIRFISDISTDEYGWIYGARAGGPSHALFMTAPSIAGHDSYCQVEAIAPTGRITQSLMMNSDSTTGNQLSIVKCSNDTVIIGAGAAATTPTRITVSNIGGVRFHAYVAGTATFDASGNITSTSDLRQKHVVRNFTYGLKEILKINPVFFSWLAKTGYDTKGVYPGFIAQNVMIAIPEAITIGHDGMMGFQDRGIIAALVNAIKELNSEITELRGARNV